MPPDRPETDRHLAFIGMAGVGKSAISRRVAALLARAVFDVDAAVVETTGRSIPDLFAELGEPRFRELETDALRHALESAVPMVIATGGGIVESPVNRELLDLHARVILLHTTDEVLMDRLRRSSNRRPLLEGDLEANLRALHERRDDLYRDVADLAVEVGFLDLTGTAGVVMDAMTVRWPDLRRAEPKGSA